MKDLITIEQICDRYGCARHKAGAIIHRIPHFVVGKRLFAAAADLEAWEREQMVYPLPKGVRTKQTPTAFVIPRRKAQ